MLAVMQTVYEAAGGAGGLLTLARAWHARVSAGDEVRDAFIHGYHPEHTERLRLTRRRGTAGSDKNSPNGVIGAASLPLLRTAIQYPSADRCLALQIAAAF